VVGSYPKPPDEGRPFVLRKTLHSVDRGEATRDDVNRAVQELASQIISEQEAAGIDIVTDGHAGWPDLLRPFAESWAGFEVGGLLRWFDNNTYYRRPVCVGPVEWRGPASVDAFRYAASVATHPVKAVVPGPVSFARLSVDEHYGDHSLFVMAVAKVLAQEVFELVAAGARHIQIDEPALLHAPDDVTLAQRALGEVLGQVASAEVTLATYFGDALELGPQLFELPGDVVALDLVSGAANLELIGQAPRGTKIQAGIVDARNTKLESVDELVATIDKIEAQIDDADLRISPSAGLEFLPREKARAKLERLAEVARKVGQ
jgi:5-methyltetrahydropteroyltriglutamate--homocysteine methyltransferase